MASLTYQQTLLLSDWPYGSAMAFILLALTTASVLLYLRWLRASRLGAALR
jgi:putative spermidine/putrescine transport system permease protein